ncbi:unnamed protein product, partial [Medioppia subpectinata]
MRHNSACSSHTWPPGPILRVSILLSVNGPTHPHTVKKSQGWCFPSELIMLIYSLGITRIVAKSKSIESMAVWRDDSFAKEVSFSSSANNSHRFLQFIVTLAANETPINIIVNMLAENGSVITSQTLEKRFLSFRKTVDTTSGAVSDGQLFAAIDVTNGTEMHGLVPEDPHHVWRTAVVKQRSPQQQHIGHPCGRTA